MPAICGAGEARGAIYLAAARLPAETPAPMSALERMRQAQGGDKALFDQPSGKIVSPGATSRQFDLQPAIGVPVASQFVAESCVGADAHRGAGNSDTEFGTFAIPIDRTRFDDRWNRVRAKAPAHLMRAQLRKAGIAVGQDEIETIQRINHWVNHWITYVPDRNRGVANDVWATAEQTIIRGQGDCEDYAILKMQMLIAAGISSDRVKLVLLRDLAANADHALLLVQTKTGKLALDNMTDRLYDGSMSQDVRPILSFSGARRWVHGYAQVQPLMLAAKIQSPLF